MSANSAQCTGGGYPCHSTNITPDNVVSFTGTYQFAANNNGLQCPGMAPSSTECTSSFSGSSPYGKANGCQFSSKKTTPGVPYNITIQQTGAGNENSLFCPQSSADSLCSSNILNANFPGYFPGTWTTTLSNKQTGSYSCGYTLGSLIDLENNTIISGFQTDAFNSTSMQQVYAYYCSLQALPTQTCPNNSVFTTGSTGVPMTTCSNMLASNSPAMVMNKYQSCQSFFLPVANSSTYPCYNASISNYCNGYTGAPDCQCFFFAGNTYFKAITQQPGAAQLKSIPTCWWTPCQLPSQSLIPLCQTTPPFAPASNAFCKNPTCVSIIKGIQAGGNIDIAPVQNCATSNTTSSNGSNSTTNNSVSAKVSSSFQNSKYLSWLLVGLVVLFIIAIVILIIYEISKHHNKS